jgi:hypothetical protein
MGKPPNEMGNCPFASHLVTPLEVNYDEMTSSARETKNKKENITSFFSCCLSIFYFL